ncbi:hypothetical protein C1752_16045 [Acaryochloris thomasi RCC1774]|uniref:DUF932 domain-containing protein n=1 Tax=Acaryochloris thomasi RCC1774 TaxID=1764569 RepID=A0A2W1JG75_9CYAN|nr:DUF932 domain-containing protein [Acaryochloris thomasi]PZD70222.1 hypothetical protein C1752_16045 [Acaryochloris thomasi RCC1774]
MKEGLTIVEMAQQLQDQASKKRDFVADTRQLEMNADGSITIEAETVERFATSEHTHAQIAQRLNIPTTYYKRMRKDAPDLLSQNVNHWFLERPEPRMLRTLDGTARAFLSNRYRRVDNTAIVQTVLPVISDFGDDLKICSIGLTDSRLYIKVINERMQLDVKVNDAVQAGVIISNSEIGLGSIRIEPLVYRLVCRNGMVIPDRGMKKYHVGRALDNDDDAYEIFTDETKQAEDAALLLKVRDMVKAATSEALFTQIVNQMRDATERKIEGNPVKAVEVLADSFTLNQSEQSDILTHLIQGGDLSQYGLLNAVTRSSQDVEDYDRATELEAMGSQVITLPAAQWKQLATAK